MFIDIVLKDSLLSTSVMCSEHGSSAPCDDPEGVHFKDEETEAERILKQAGQSISPGCGPWGPAAFLFWKMRIISGYVE